MNKDQTLSIIRLITTYFPNFKFKDEPREVREDILHAWHVILQKHDFEQSLKNLVRYAERESFPPKVADIVGGGKGRIIPTFKETMAMLQEQEKLASSTTLLLKDPREKEEIEQEKAKIEAILGIRKSGGVEHGGG